MANKLLTIGFVLIALGLIATYALGLNLMTGVFWIFIAGVMLLLRAGTGKMIPIPLNTKYAAIGGVVLLLIFGWQTGMIDGLTGGVAAGAITGEVITGIEPTPTVTSDVLADCRERAGAHQLGTSATVSYDIKEIEPEVSVAYGAFRGWVVNQHGTYLLDNESSASLSTAKMGDVLNFYGGGNATYYYDKLENFCVDGQQVTAPITTHAIQALTSLALTGYDDTGTTALTAGTTGEEDYGYTLGTDEEKILYIKLKNNAADKAYDHGAWAVAAKNNINSFKPISDDAGGTYSVGYMPYYLDHEVLYFNWTEDGDPIRLNFTGGFDKVYVRDSVLRLHEWDFFKTKFQIESTGNPASADAASCTQAASDLAYALTLDYGYSKGTDEQMHYNYYKPAEGTSSEVDVGLLQNVTCAPLAKYDCFVVEGL
jgi:hypothetical protein